MGNCKCCHTHLNEPTLNSKAIISDSINLDTMSPSLLKLAELAISHQTDSITLIDLRNKDLGEDGSAVLDTILMSYTHISSLLLSATNLGPENWTNFSKTLSNFFKLITLDLSHNNIGSYGAEKLAGAIEKLMRLETLILDNGQLEGSGMILICGGLVNLRNLKVLSLRENKIGDLGIRMLSNIINHLPKLIYLDIHHNQISISGSYYIGKCIESLPFLQVLKAGNNFLMKEGGNNVVSKLPLGIRELSLENVGLEDSHIVLLAPLLVSLKNLEVLVLDHNFLGPKSAQVLCEVLPKIKMKHLSLIGCNVSEYRKALSFASSSTEILL